MAIIIRSDKHMVSHINMAVAGARTHEYEMVVVPMVLPDTIEKANTLLLDVKNFDPRIATDVLPQDAVGKVSIGKDRSVHDALDELESLTMLSAQDLLLAFTCAVSEHVKGKTRRITTKMGDFIVNLKQFAELSGLPMNSNGTSEHPVFLREVIDKRFGDKKIMFVMVKGASTVTGGSDSKPTALQSMMARLEARANTGLEPGASFHARDLDNGWQLYNNAQFVDLLSWWKRGYHYFVTTDENQGIHIDY